MIVHKFVRLEVLVVCQDFIDFYTHGIVSLYDHELVQNMCGRPVLMDKTSQGQRRGYFDIVLRDAQPFDDLVDVYVGYRFVFVEDTGSEHDKRQWGAPDAVVVCGDDAWAREMAAALEADFSICRDTAIVRDASGTCARFELLRDGLKKVAAVTSTKIGKEQLSKLVKSL